MAKDKVLNKEQKMAIEHINGPLLIIAGAGTGKTTVVTERVKHLVFSGAAKASEILGLTFTEKAAREMEERIDVELPYGYTQMTISTFHSFCDGILRDEALHIGYDPRFRLMTESETIQLIKQHLFDFDLKYFRPLGNPNKFISGLLQHFSRLQDENITPEEYLKWAKKQLKKTKDAAEEISIESEKWQELASAYQKYEEIKLKLSLMDYGDLIVKTLFLFKNRPNILKSYQQRYKYILVDEYQDTNFAQNELACLLAQKHQNITVCGDDDQSIYRFRGAAISNMLQFRKNFSDTKTVVLTRNYRSHQTILDHAYKLIQHNNPDRLEVVENIDKRLLSMKSVGKGKTNPLAFIHVERVEDEADSIAKQIQRLVVEEKKYQYRDLAILVRANNHADPIMRGLLRRGIPHQFLGPGRLFKQPEIVDLIAYLKVLNNFEDSISLYRVLSYDYFGIDIRDLVKLSNVSKRNNQTLFEAAEGSEQLPLSAEAKEKISNIISFVKTQLPLTKKVMAGQLLFNFLEKFELMPKLLNPVEVEAQTTAKSISRFFNKINAYEVEHPDSGISELMDWIELATELGESPLAADSDWTEVNAVNILTVHSSKGLEFPVVFLVNLVGERFPTRVRHEQIPIPQELIREVLPAGDFHLQEERRLFYVGMTRAKDLLFLTAANYYGEGKREKKLSPFIFESLGEAITKSEQSNVNRQQLSLLDFVPFKPRTAIRQPSLHIDYLSYSQIETFNICPLHYKLRYIVGLPSAPSGAQSFGISLHSALKDFYLMVKAKEKPSLKLMQKLLEKNWIRLGYQSKVHEKQAYEKANQYVRNYYRHEFSLKKLPELLEQPFTVGIETEDARNLKIGGKMDRVDLLPNGQIEIIDYKSGSTIPTQREVDQNMQLTFYALGATKVTDPPFAKKPEQIILSLYFFEGNQKISTKRTAEQLEKAEKNLIKIRETIEQSDFKCVKGIWCENCEYALFCRADE